jgi:hypothetical protein
VSVDDYWLRRLFVDMQEIACVLCPEAYLELFDFKFQPSRERFEGL